MNLKDTSWKNIKSKLYDHFSYLCNTNLITTQLENLRQKKKESIAEYAERARKLLNKKNAMYSNLTGRQKDDNNRIAYKAFARGLLNPNIQSTTFTRGATTLEDAIETALDTENDTMYQIPKAELYCKTCKINGHREADCRRKANEDDPIFNLVTAMRNIGPVNFKGFNDTRMRRTMVRQPNPQPRNYNFQPDRMMLNRNENNFDFQRNRMTYGFNQNRNMNNQNPSNENQYYNRNTNQNVPQNQPQPLQQNRNIQNTNNIRRNMNSQNNIAINRRSRSQNPEN